MTGHVPPQDPVSAHHQQADQEAARRACEYRERMEAEQRAAEAARQAKEIAERQRREQERAAADQANRIGWSGQRR